MMETDRYRIEDDVLIVKDGVTSINESEFKGMEIREVRLPDGLTRIWDYAFSGCISLKKIRFPYTMEYICSSSFRNCKKLKEVVVPSNTKIYEHAFDGCDALEKVIIRDVEPVRTAK